MTIDFQRFFSGTTSVTADKLKVIYGQNPSFFFFKETDHKFKRIVLCILWLYLYRIPLKLKISWNIQAGHTTSNRCTQNIHIYGLSDKRFMSLHFRLRVHWVAGSRRKYLYGFLTRNTWEKWESGKVDCQ